jgi:hypothetical protein
MPAPIGQFGLSLWSTLSSSQYVGSGCLSTSQYADFWLHLQADPCRRYRIGIYPFNSLAHAFEPPHNLRRDISFTKRPGRSVKRRAKDGIGSNARRTHSKIFSAAGVAIHMAMSINVNAWVEPAQLTLKLHGTQDRIEDPMRAGNVLGHQIDAG